MSAPHGTATGGLPGGSPAPTETAVAPDRPRGSGRRWARPAPAPRRGDRRGAAPPPPTPEQTAVIEAPLEPLLVVAGAGSGKTETMAARVVWLVANGIVRPSRCSA